jgi:hypothetical protein
MDVNISLIDYIGIIENGVGLLLSIRVIDDIYEIIYWFNVDGNIKIITEEDFLILLGVKDIYEYDGLDNLINKIESVIPDKIDILKEFSLIEKHD